VNVTVRPLTAGGSWVATIDDEVVGTALALRRDSLWGLSLLAVDPRVQSSDAGALSRRRRTCPTGLTCEQRHGRGGRASLVDVLHL
jgi:hypothetical protein